MSGATSGPTRVFAIVPAAGQSRRMGCAKQMLDVGGRPMVLAVVEPLVAAEVVGVVLVTQRRIAEQLGALPPGVFVAWNEDESSEMIDSVRIGLRTWAACEPVGARDGFLVCPADQPGITTGDFDACITAFREAPRSIVIASYAGRRGHPVICPAALAAFVQSTACDHGLNALPRAFAEAVVVVECHSPGITRDVDTPGDCGCAGA